jgi:RNA ligase (TIGR02306 family)
MSDWGVTVEKIGKVWPHPNADRLELASIEGMTYQFVVPKDQYVVGDEVIYFPIDSLLPQQLIIDLGLEGKLSGKDKNRVKTIKLRQQISQGIVAHVLDIIDEDTFDKIGLHKNIADLLEITKWEGLELNVRDGKLVLLPPLVNVYDIEGADRHPELVAALLDQEVVITEKVEGSHFSATLYEDGTYAVCQRRYRILADEDKVHDWHKLANDLKVLEALQDIQARYATPAVTLRGEVVGPGVQGNIYNLTHKTIYFFEVEIGGISENPVAAQHLCNVNGLPTVPIIYKGILNEFLEGKTVQEASHGKTLLHGAVPEALREGIVIRPVKETWDAELGRLIVKQRDPIYLEQTGL